MANFLVAGAGHGGLCAALHLARAGERVTVAEKKPVELLGYDWTDAVERGILVRNGFSDLPEEHAGTYHNAAMFGPAKRWPKLPAEPTIPRQMHAERRELLATMIADCREAGVEFLFETEITGPVVEDDRVIGLHVRSSEGEKTLLADMVVDAAGWQSPVRMGLPEEFLVPAQLGYGQVLYIWRGYLNRLAGPEPEYVSKYYLGHRGRKGFSWAIANPESMDVLLGNIDGPLSEDDIAAGLADLREDNPLLGETLLRGGQRATIPLRRPLGMLAANGYAAVGDSACMTDPLGGSGVGSAMDQGKVLANVLLTHCKGDFSLAKLWKYQYRTFTEKPAAEIGFATATAQDRAATDVLKSTVMSLNPKQMDLLFQRGLIAMGGVNGPGDAVKVLLGNLDHLPFVFKLAKMGGRSRKIKALVGSIPAEYESQAVAEWVKAYEEFAMV